MRGKKEDITGKTFSSLFVEEQLTERTKAGDIKYRCKCKCGNYATHTRYELVKGIVVSCGCHKTAIFIERNTSHGLSGTPEYITLGSMKERCYNPNNSAYKNYGGRGIKICDRWLGKDGPTNFLSDMGKRPAKMTIDRIDNNGDYEPNNCRWVTRKQQLINRRNNIYLTIYDEKRCVTEWCSIFGLNPSGIRCRFQNGWAPEVAIFAPKYGKSRKFGDIARNKKKLNSYKY